MADIYIVNHTVGGLYAENWTYYHRTEVAAQEDFHECVKNASEDPNIVALIRLDVETLDATTINSWEGTSLDLEDMDSSFEDDEEIMVGQL